VIPRQACRDARRETDGFAMFLPVKSVDVVGDGRACEGSVVLRAVGIIA